jgi:hypothetical protein
MIMQYCRQSDVVLALNKFLMTIPYGRVINISLYFIAQFMIITAAWAIWMDAGGEHDFSMNSREGGKI